MEQFSGNYTGPYWSNGKFQESVAFGDTDPQSELDKLSRLHDSAYYQYKDRAHREAADLLYKKDADTLVGRFPELAGSAVQYGNYTQRQASQLADDAAHYGILGPIVFAGRNMYNANKMLNGDYLSKEKQDILKYYDTDPRKGQAAVTFSNKPKPPNSSKEARQQLPTKEQTAQVVSAAKTVKGKAANILKKIGEVVGSVKKHNAVIPETTSQRNVRLIEAQKEKLDNHNLMYLRAQLKPSKPRKYKKKKHNLTKAVRVLPAHCIH